MRLTLSVDINILQEELHITDKAAFDVHVKTMQDKSRAMHLTDEQKQRMQSKKDARKKAEEEMSAGTSMFVAVSLPPPLTLAVAPSRWT